MIKFLYYTNLLYPILLNLMMMILIMIPMKKKNFHPMFFSLILMIYTIIMTLKINLMNFTLVPYIIFLIIIGGLMVIFMYITSLANNELFYFSFEEVMKIIVKFMFLMFLILMIFYTKFVYLDMNLNWFINDFNYKYIFNLSVNYDYYNNSLFFIMMYLFFSLVCIMNICYLYKMPMRQIFHND